MRFCLNNRLFEERYDTASQICDHETKKKKYDVDDEDKNDWSICRHKDRIK